MKYLIRARAEIDGIVDKSDIVGAIFGQTEGLFSPDFDLRELQDKGRIGRIVVDIKQQGTRTTAEVLVPSNLDKAETALVAAMIEFVDKVGPYSAKIKVIDIIDVRYEKIKRITERAKDILKKWFREKTIDVREIINE
ncbi:MAG: DNA primase, partial [Desulfurococcales archaeon]|nr:DNA primase [Desulfurococcales archaeon]